MEIEELESDEPPEDINLKKMYKVYNKNQILLMKDHEKKEQDKEFEKILADFDTILEGFAEDKNIKILEHINKFLYEESLLTGEKSHVDVK